MVPKLKKTVRNGLTASEPKSSIPRLDLETVSDCACGHYPWDDWEKAALAAGVPSDLASLGRETMREAYQHGWIEALQVLCGWNDQGRQMIKLALRSPKRAKRRWQRLLATDGYRGEYDKRIGEWKTWA